MFKKRGDVALAPSHLVSGADRKRLSRQAAEAFGLDSEAAAALLPPKGGLALSRFSPPSRAGQLDGSCLGVVYGDFEKYGSNCQRHGSFVHCKVGADAKFLSDCAARAILAA